MKLWILAGVMTIAPMSCAAAAEVGDDAACQADTTRQDVHADAPQTPATQAPLTPTSRTVATVQRDGASAPPVHADASRRRSGKPVPDSELIAPRGAL